MKIRCDVCNRDEALVFCTADEAALCDGCDHRVHHANKLASKHQRVCLLQPSLKDNSSQPLCDICKEKRALLFCLQDRAILCRDCDGPIHTANEHTLKHNRFLLTGIKLSPTATVYSPSSTTSTTTTSPPSSQSSSVTNGGDLVPDSLYIQQPQQQLINMNPNPNSRFKSLSLINNNNTNSNITGGDHFGYFTPSAGVGSTNTNTNTNTSSIPEYLIETLPGRHVEEFLDLPSTPFGFCMGDDPYDLLSMGDYGIGDFESQSMKNNITSSSDKLGIWVPQQNNQVLYQTQQHNNYYPQMTTWLSCTTPANNNVNVFKEMTTTNTKSSSGVANNNNRKWTEDLFSVPQIASPPSITGSKRSRTFW